MEICKISNEIFMIFEIIYEIWQSDFLTYLPLEKGRLS